MSATQSVGVEARRVGRSTALRTVVRAGFAAYGVFHLAVAWLALEIARGKGAEGDQSGAFKLLQQQPGGTAILVIVIVGLIAMALWQLLIATTGYSAQEGRQGTFDRIVAGGRVLVYTALAVTAITVMAGNNTSSAGQQQRTTAGILAHPAGQVLVAIVGLVVIGVGIGMGLYGGRRVFKKKLMLGSMSRRTRRLVVALGVIGYVAKGIALGIAGGLVVDAAVSDQASRSTGLDGALHTLARQPAGAWLLGTIAIGFAAYGVYCFWQARYRKV
jgi:Domain of Unknown Function (DUF1206)